MLSLSTAHSFPLLEVGRRGIRVNAVAPGIMETPAAAGIIGSSAAREAAARQYPLPGIGSPDELAELMVWLLSDKASYVTGTVLRVGGPHANSGIVAAALRPIAGELGALRELGVAAIPTYFRPWHQKHRGETCGGVELAIVEPARVGEANGRAPASPIGGDARIGRGRRA